MKENVLKQVDGVYETSGDYAHAIEIVRAERLVYVSGTMGLDEQGRAGATLDRQLALIWSNIEAILKSAALGLGDIVRVTSYLTDRAFVEANQNARLRALDGKVVPTTAIVVGTLSDDWLVEIEVIAAR